MYGGPRIGPHNAAIDAIPSDSYTPDHYAVWTHKYGAVLYWGRIIELISHSYFFFFLF